MFYHYVDGRLPFASSYFEDRADFDLLCDEKCDDKKNLDYGRWDTLKLASRCFYDEDLKTKVDALRIAYDTLVKVLNIISTVSFTVFRWIVKAFLGVLKNLMTIIVQLIFRPLTNKIVLALFFAQLLSIPLTCIVYLVLGVIKKYNQIRQQQTAEKISNIIDVFNV